MSRTQSMPSAGKALESRGQKVRLNAFYTGLAAGIVHDLGNLIQIASSAVNIVARNPGIHTAGLEPVITGAKISLERAGELVKQTIGAVSARATSVEQVSLAACLAEVETLIQFSWRHDIRLDIHANSDLPAVECDPLALQNAVLNLVFNARDAMPNGGVISIRAEEVLPESRNEIELRVADSGIGMRPDTITRAFDPFFTTKCDGLGGVGLPMVEHFAQELGGRVVIESEYGVGTTVRLQLPVSPPSSGSRLAPGTQGNQRHAISFRPDTQLPAQESDQ